MDELKAVASLKSIQDSVASRLYLLLIQYAALLVQQRHQLASQQRQHLLGPAARAR